ncbi:MAG TPA: YfhO family protein, partial [Gemmatimonadaceae bacterium]|nr:YfhO family protein [Gemmatimonadaceae bacterium]
GQAVKAQLSPLTIEANVTRYDPGHISVRLDAAAPAGSALVVSENYYPGWRATVDGEPAAVGRADYVLIGVALPAGARSIDLTFQSESYERGKTITLVAIALSILGVLVGSWSTLTRRTA